MLETVRIASCFSVVLPAGSLVLLLPMRLLLSIRCSNRSAPALDLVLGFLVSARYLLIVVAAESSSCGSSVLVVLRLLSKMPLCESTSVS